MPFIAATGEQASPTWEAMDDFSEQQRRPVTVLDIGRVYQGMDEIALGVGQDMQLAAVTTLQVLPSADLLDQSLGPPLSVVLTLWLSMAPAMDEASRP